MYCTKHLTFTNTSFFRLIVFVGLLRSHIEDKLFPPPYSTNRLVFVMKAHSILCEIRSELLILLLHTNWKHQSSPVACTDSACSVRMQSGRTVATRHSPQNLAHAYLQHSWQESSPGLWTVLVVIFRSGWNCPEGTFYFMAFWIVIL
jgi:hypothetical protein